MYSKKKFNIVVGYTQPRVLITLVSNNSNIKFTSNNYVTIYITEH